MEIWTDFKHILRVRKLKETKAFLHKHGRVISPLSLALGFVVDILTLTRVDLFLDNFILLSQLTFVGISIFGLNAYDAGRLRHRFWDRLVPWLPYVLQFAFGGLMSGFLVLYTRSATVWASWPFLFILLFLFLSNEFNQERYQRLVIQLGLYYFAILSYLIFAIPVLINRVGAWIFILSGVMSLGIFYLIIRGLRRITPWKLQFNRKAITIVVAVVLVFYNFIYFTNIIPPIPLSLKEIRVAYSVINNGRDFVIQYEKPPWYQFYRKYDKTFDRVGSAGVYVYASVFAPADIRSEIAHHWYHFDENRDDWVASSVIPYPILGGRDGGYRGYSVKQAVSPGKWRIDVKNSRGQTLGRAKITIKEVSQAPELTTIVR